MKDWYFVTGGAGFIGSHLVKRLVKDGFKVLVIDNFNEDYPSFIKRANIKEVKKYASNDKLKIFEGDILDITFLEDIFNNFQIKQVIHLAARAGVRRSLKFPRSYFEVNVIGTINILECCKKFDVNEFIFASSSSVYGGNKKVPFSEDDRVDTPASPYGASKKSAELILSTFHDLYGINITSLRFFTVYGPRQRPEMAIHKFVRLISEDRNIPVFGDGTSGRDYTYIDDIIEGIVLAIKKVKGYKIYNLGDSRVVFLKELIKMLEELLHKKAKVEYLPYQSGDVAITYADITKAKKELGFEPKVKIEEGLKRFIDWFVQKEK